ncbi:hypothetical protein CERZMDRAFT_47840 [Cercospora zeae-maydis SCOH1-5]|uniref:AMP-dependent synthetase/ligase domain-containing protein n=1 Tax=Cercospora zeae-maydis SCOH1-5 TaxID=717836 RepID=A0A6A6F8G5_9PEZI|nr:hypothetical protein CERZMDRAFT_47840 [Cercospora zeae-maydis SCOH1-5]
MHRKKPPSDANVAQISGGQLPTHTSVFQHLEEGLHRSLNEPAIICPHQSYGHLDKLVSEEGVIRGDGTPSPRSELECMTLTYEELHCTALKLVDGLIALGARPRSTILIAVPNRVEFAIILWASILMQLTMVNMDVSSLEVPEHNHLKDALRTLRPSIVLLQGFDVTEAVRVAAHELNLAPPLYIALDAPFSGKCIPFSQLLTGRLKADDEYELLQRLGDDDPNRIHSITFTSGTTSKPKGCPLRVKGMSHMLHSWSWLINKDNGTRSLQQLHNSRAIAPAQMLQTWKAGGTVVMPGRNFVIEDTLDAITNHDASFIVLSPAMVHRLGEIQGGHSLATSSVRSIQIGGDAVTKDVLDKCARIFPTASICAHHGMSEGGAAFKCAFFDTPTTEVDFQGGVCPIGTVAAGSTIRIWDQRRDRVALRGEPGDMHITSPSIIEHYLGGADGDSFLTDATARWFRTGDVAVMDDAGIVSILGRRKDAIEYRDGTLIMPSSIESRLEEYLEVQVCVVAISHSAHGSRPVAVVETLGGSSPRTVMDYVQQTLGCRYALVGLFTLDDIGLRRFPLNAARKVVRSVLQEAVMSHIHVQGHAQ